MTKIGIVIEKEDTSMTIIGAVKKSGAVKKVRDKKKEEAQK